MVVLIPFQKRLKSKQSGKSKEIILLNFALNFIFMILQAANRFEGTDDNRGHTRGALVAW